MVRQSGFRRRQLADNGGKKLERVDPKQRKQSRMKDGLVMNGVLTKGQGRKARTRNASSGYTVTP